MKKSERLAVAPATHFAFRGRPPLTTLLRPPTPSLISLQTSNVVPCPPVLSVTSIFLISTFFLKFSAYPHFMLGRSLTIVLDRFCSARSSTEYPIFIYFPLLFFREPLPQFQHGWKRILRTTAQALTPAFHRMPPAF